MNLTLDRLRAAYRDLAAMQSAADRQAMHEHFKTMMASHGATLDDILELLVAAAGTVLSTQETWNVSQETLDSGGFLQGEIRWDHTARDEWLAKWDLVWTCPKCGCHDIWSARAQRCHGDCRAMRADEMQDRELAAGWDPSP